MREIKIYSYNELGKDAQQKAYIDWLGYAEYPFYDDMYETLKEFENMFNGYIKVQDISFQRERVIFRWAFDEEVANLSGVRLLKYVWNNFGDKLYKGKYYSSNNNPKREFKSRKSKILMECECPLTGCYTDYLILDRFITFMHSAPTKYMTLVDLIQSCFDMFMSEAIDCINEWFCRDIFHDECEVNDFEFYEDGSRCYR